MKPAQTSIKLHPITQSQVNAALNRPATVYIFAGMKGVGKLTTANQMAQSLGGGDVSSVLRLQPTEGKKRLSITEVHQLIHDLQLKSFLPDEQRVVIVEQADTLSPEAANAFLKALEEPPERVIFILIVQTVADLLPTIRSRSVLIRFLPLPNAASNTEPEILDLAGEFLDGNISHRFMIARQIHDQKNHAQFLQALYEQTRQRPAVAIKLMTIEQALAHNVSSRLSFEYLALELGRGASVQ